MWFRWQKIGPAAGKMRQSRALSVGQYTPAGCLRYEKIYGRNYIYTGGDAVSQQLLEQCQDLLVPGARVLDVGAGMGGTMLHFAEKVPGIYLHGVCCSSEMTSFFTGRHIRRSPEVRQ